MKYNKGAFYIILSSVVFGFIPVLSKEGQSAGVNAVTMTFLRMVLTLPFMAFVLIGRGSGLRLKGKELKSVMLLGFFGMAGAMLALNFSYGFIGVGTATAVHFVYPVLIILYCVIRGEKKRASEWAALAAVMCGITLFVERGGGANQAVGLGAAFASGVFYAFYVLYSARSVRELDYFKTAFYVCLFAGVAMLLYGAARRGLDFSFGARGWIIALFISMLASLCAVPLFQLGVKAAGASKAGVLSSVEPVTGLFFGHMLLGETVTVYKLIGCTLIAAGIIMIEKKK